MEPVRGRDFFQAAKPAHWIIQEEVVLPNGRHLQGAKARVYEVLRLALETSCCFPIGRHLAQAGWVPTWVLREPWAGGAAGDRRVRDLRALGVAIEGRPFDAGDEAASASWVWQLGGGFPSRPGNRPGRPIPREKPLAREERVSSAPLSGLHFRLHPGARPARWLGELLDLSPGMPHVAAPTASLAQHVQEGRLSPAEALEIYRRQLLTAWRGGELARAFRPGKVTICCESPFDALPVLQRALEHLGATGEAAP
jgi:hypothetical protein